jgi:hypothetical protein
MIHDLIVWLFGVSAWGALCNLPAWSRLFLERVAHPQPSYLKDKYLLVRGGMVFQAIAVGLACWLRAASFMEYPQTQPPQVISLFGWWPVSLPGWGPLVWIVFMAIAEVMFLRVAALNAQQAGRVSWAWMIFVFGLLLWTPFVAIMHP